MNQIEQLSPSIKFTVQHVRNIFLNSFFQHPGLCGDITVIVNMTDPH